jgi:hypothetical protein
MSALRALLVAFVRLAALIRNFPKFLMNWIPSCCCLDDMKAATHDNDNDTWQTLGLATARLLQKIEDRQNECAPDETSGEDEHQKKVSEHDAYIEWRVREADRFERLAKGERTRRKRIT